MQSAVACLYPVMNQRLSTRSNDENVVPSSTGPLVIVIAVNASAEGKPRGRKLPLHIRWPGGAVAGIDRVGVTILLHGGDECAAARQHYGRARGPIRVVVEIEGDWLK